MVIGTSSSLDDIDLHSADRYGAHGYPWAEWDRLRAEAPVYWYDRPGVAPFWAITRHEDIHFISSNDSAFINGGPRLRLATIADDERFRAGMAARVAHYGWDPDEPMDLVFMDRPRHTKFRTLTSRRFTPRAMRTLEADLEVNAARFTAEFVAVLERDGSADIVDDYAVKLPLATICELLGLPVDDWATVHEYTEALFDDDDERHRNEMTAALRAYLDDLIAARRAARSEDLAAAVVHGEIDGHSLTDQQLNGYLFLLVAAGNETTRNATSRGITALLERPEQLERLLADPQLIDTAVEEILRWTSPVIQFARTATADVELRGQRIRAGDTVGLFYPSANRDDAVFEDPYAFDVGREPNHHMAFGHGVHFCLGAHLARLEMRVVFEALLRAFGTIELAGDVEWTRSNRHTGIRRLPLRVTRSSA